METVITLTSFFNHFEKEVISCLLADEIKLTLVGGAVRDWLVFSRKSDDLDFEVRNIDYTDLKRVLTSFISSSKNVKLTEFPFGVLRLTHDDGQTIEFSLPRIEVVIDPYHHHYFKAELRQDLSYKEAFLRRDFTLNAIGLEIKSLDQGLIIDPFNGLEDGKNKVLNFVSREHFPLDPVRFLRAFRFKWKFHFDFSHDLKDVLLKMPLNKLTLHYFKEEWRKSGNLFWVLEVFDALEQVELKPSFFEQVIRIKDTLIELQNNTQLPDLKNEVDFKKLGQFFYFNSKLEFLDLSQEKIEIEFARMMFGLSEKEMKALLNVRALWKKKTFVINDFGINEHYHFFLKILQKRLSFLATHEDFFKTYYPNSFANEWMIYKNFKDIETNLSNTIKNEREQMAPLWRSLYTLHLAFLKTI